VESGVLVVSIEQDSPALASGLSSGDIIVAFDGRSIAGIDDLLRALTEETVGKRSRITIIRRTEKMDLEIVPRES
jgi:S1-C subfamily serine protease